MFILYFLTTISNAKYVFLYKQLTNIYGSKRRHWLLLARNQESQRGDIWVVHWKMGKILKGKEYRQGYYCKRMQQWQSQECPEFSLQKCFDNILLNMEDQISFCAFWSKYLNIFILSLNSCKEVIYHKF